MKGEVAGVQVVLAHESLPEWRIVISGGYPFLELPKKLADLTDEFLRADDRDLHALFRKGFGIVWSVLVDLLVDRPGSRDRAAGAKNTTGRIEGMRVPGVSAVGAFMRRLVDPYAQPHSAHNGRFLFKPGPQGIKTLHLVLSPHDAECLLQQATGESVVTVGQKCPPYRFYVRSASFEVTPIWRKLLNVGI